ncbi:MAG: UDP-2,3-diacylglucosamine diphosphatase LpxI, partial [Veillonella sp.]|nr:UDP-2,3-diacylglucosamine diphosphatase LpxI [Veillonella sp.]
VVVIGVVPDIDPALKAEADAFYDIGVAKLGKIFKTLKKEEVEELTMLGKVTKEILFKGLTFPDLKTLGVLKRLKNRKDDTIMLAIVDEIEREGFKVLDQTVYLKPFMPKVGVLSKAQPTDEQWADIDIGQTVVVKHKAAMAIEAIEGTDKCILRGGELGRGDAVVVKTEKPNQDVRFDVPAVGIKTLMSMIDSGCKVLAVEAEKTIFVQQQDVLDMADRHGIVICAVDQEFVNSRKDA